ncbi:hypothetical protein [Hymenobacter sp. UYAg731]
MIILLTMFLGMVLWMAYFFYFRTDGHGRAIQEADSPEAEVRGQQLLSRVDNLVNQRQYDAAKVLLDSIRDADANPTIFINDNSLEQRFDTLRRRTYRERHTQQ